MREQHLTFNKLFGILLILSVGLLAASLLSAWTGPTATAPGGNIAAPINVGTTDQIKNAGLSVNALTVFGSSYIQSKLGIGVVSPVVALDVAGSLKLGNGGELCQAVSEGAMRYNSGSKIMEYCNGVEWCPVAGCAPPPPPPPQTQQWVIWAYPGYEGYIYFTPYDTATTPHTYNGNTFYVYDPIKWYSGTFADAQANPTQALAAAVDIPIGYTRTPMTRFVFNFAQLESEPASTQNSTIQSITSWIVNRYLCTQNVVNASQCHVNNLGVGMPAFSRTTSDTLYGSYTDSNSGVGFTTYRKAVVTVTLGQ